MATRSAIGIKHGNRIKAVYCHYDGYLEHVGRALDTYYKDSVKVNKLISMGDMSGIGADIGEKHLAEDRRQYLDDGIATQCTFYNRDREDDESKTAFKSFGSEQEFIEFFEGSWCEYFYLYDNGTWYYSTLKNKNKPFEKLEYGIVMEALTQ
jgi:hypothetical protein